MPRARTFQQSIRFPCGWGGKRAGAGRPPKQPGRPGIAHVTRPRLSPREPLHVTLRLRDGIDGSLRRRDGFRAVRWALAVATRRDDFRVCHMSIQGNHLHLIVEAASRRALARGMQGFAISCARQLNRLRDRTGRVFADRYHARPLTSPRQVRSALAYVLNNWRRHGEDRGVRAALDPYASGGCFDGWTTEQRVRLRPGQEVLPVAFPTCWLLTTGWRRHRRIDVDEVPGKPKLENERRAG